MKLLTIIFAFLILFSSGCSDKCSGDFPYYHSNLCWSPLEDSTTHWAADNFCGDMGGRLPTISELRTLIQNCPNSETDGTCKVTDECYSEECWDKSLCWSCEEDLSGRYSAFGDSVLGMWASNERPDSICEHWSINFQTADIGSCYGDLWPYSSFRCVVETETDQ